MSRKSYTQAALNVLVLAALLISCSGPTRTSPAPADSFGTAPTTSAGDLEGTDWVLLSLNGESLVPGSNITLSFAEGAAGGFAGCNAFGGDYAAEGGRLRLPALEVTAQGCQEPAGIMEQEAAFLEALQRAATYRLVDSRLEIDNTSGQIVLVLARVEASIMDPNDLLSTQWRLMSLDGSPPTEGSTITLAFRNELQVLGHAGCRDYVASYQANGDDVGFPSLSMIGEACPAQPALMDQEGHYTDALSWATDYRLGEGQLRILTARGEELVFEPLPEEGAARLETTPWMLSAFVESREAEGMSTPVLIVVEPLPETEISAVFETGVVSGTAGCNRYSASYVLDGPNLTLEAPVFTETACLDPAGLMEQEQRYLSTLSGPTTYFIHGQRLWLEAAEGRGLTFSALGGDGEPGN